MDGLKNEQNYGWTERKKDISRDRQMNRQRIRHIDGMTDEQTLMERQMNRHIGGQKEHQIYR